MKQLLILLAFFFAADMHAHQSNVSTTMLVEQETGTWEIYVNTSLHAFEYEVGKQFGEDAFATAEEFKELALRHLRNTLSITFNGNERAALTEGSIKLGHETSVVFTLTNLPEDLEDLRIENTAFADIHRNKSILVVLKKGHEKVQLELSATNDHSVTLDLRGEKIQKVVTAGIGRVSTLSVTVLLLGVFVLIGLGFFGFRMRAQS